MRIEPPPTLQTLVTGRLLCASCTSSSVPTLLAGMENPLNALLSTVQPGYTAFDIGPVAMTYRSSRGRVGAGGFCAPWVCRCSGWSPRKVQPETHPSGRHAGPLGRLRFGGRGMTLCAAHPLSDGRSLTTRPSLSDRIGAPMRKSNGNRTTKYNTTCDR